MKLYIVNRPARADELPAGRADNPRLDPDYDTLQVMNTVLGGSNGRSSACCEKKRATHTAPAADCASLRYRATGGGMDVRTEVTEASLRDLLAELAKMRDQPVPAEELRTRSDR
jgi:predicted Zn-dependent peptidase